MPEYEGLVAGIKEDGKAEVVIQPGSPGIPGTSREVKRKVCHRATDGSTITIEAENRVGAGVGDRVSVNRETTALLKNAAALLGIPAIGIIAGIAIAALLTGGFSTHITSGMLTIAACLLLGIIIGVLTFRRVSAGNQPVIGRIIRRRLEMPSIPGDDKCSFEKPNAICDGCAGPFP